MCTSISRNVIFLLKISHLNVKDRCFAFDFILQLYHRIFSIKCLRHLFSFEAFRCSDYWRIVLKRRRHLFLRKRNYPHEISNFIILSFQITINKYHYVQTHYITIKLPLNIYNYHYIHYITTSILFQCKTLLTTVIS